MYRWCISIILTLPSPRMWTIYQDSELGNRDIAGSKHVAGVNTHSDKQPEHNRKYRQGYLVRFGHSNEAKRRRLQIRGGSVRHAGLKHSQRPQMVSSRAILPVAVVCVNQCFFFQNEMMYTLIQKILHR